MMERKISAVLADLDGTLMEKGGDIAYVNIAAMKRLHELGVKVGIASGRPADDKMASLAKAWGLGFDFDVMIGMNGGQLWDKDHEGVKQVHMIDEKTIEDIYRIMEPMHKNAFVYDGNCMIANELDELMLMSKNRNHMDVDVIGYEHPEKLWAKPNNKLLYRLPADEIPAVLAYLDTLPADERYRYFKTAPEVIEFQDPRVNKGTGLHAYAEQNDLPVSEIAAFGDEQNDIEMIREAGLGVCLLNGCDAAKAAADAVTEYNAESGGFGRWIFAHLLNESYEEK